MKDTDSAKGTHKRVSVEAREYLVHLGEGYHEISSSCKQQVRNYVKSKFPIYPGAFDMIKLRQQRSTQKLRSLSDQDLDTLTVVEVKASDRNLPNTLNGYFFSFQYAEQLMAQTLGAKYKIVFVVLPRNRTEPFHKVMSVQEIWAKARTIHMQWSIKF